MKNNPISFLPRQKQVVDAYLKQLIQKMRKTYHMHEQQELTFSYFEDFVQSGKTVRGALFLEFAELFQQKQSRDELLPFAAAIELIHSALLIQDDFMDQDPTRRGQPSLYTLFEKEAQDKNMQYAEVYTPSAIICATDIMFFMGLAEFSKVPTPLLSNLITYMVSEYMHVGFSQWKDVELGHFPPSFVPSFEEINQVYKYKTARYTFTAPILFAAKLAEVPQFEIDNLDVATEHLGMVFQITDDRLNMFGDPKITGKPIGTDVAEGKKTFYFYHLNKALEKPENARWKLVLDSYGKKNVTNEDIEMVQTALKETGVVDMINEQIANHKQSFHTVLEKSTTSTEVKSLLTALFEFIETREK